MCIYIYVTAVGTDMEFGPRFQIFQGTPKRTMAQEASEFHTVHVTTVNHHRMQKVVPQKIHGFVGAWQASFWISKSSFTALYFI
jgi:hypothetical protein